MRWSTAAFATQIVRLPHQLQFFEAMTGGRIDRVGSHGDLHAGLDRSLERVGVRLKHLVNFGE